MTDEQITRALAEKVMGWEKRGYWWGSHPKTAFEMDIYDADDLLVRTPCCSWNPLVNDADACAVLDKIAEGPWDVDLNRNTGRWCCVIERGFDDFEEACSEFSPAGRRRAICEAALRAVGAWE